MPSPGNMCAPAVPCPACYPFLKGKTLHKRAPKSGAPPHGDKPRALAKPTTAKTKNQWQFCTVYLQAFLTPCPSARFARTRAPPAAPLRQGSAYNIFAPVAHGTTLSPAGNSWPRYPLPPPVPSTALTPHRPFATCFSAPSASQYPPPHPSSRTFRDIATYIGQIHPINHPHKPLCPTIHANIPPLSSTQHSFLTTPPFHVILQS